MILEISSALMSMSFLLRRAFRAGAQRFSASRPFNFVELCRHAAVVHRAADPRDDAADERRIHLGRQRHLPRRWRRRAAAAARACCSASSGDGGRDFGLEHAAAAPSAARGTPSSSPAAASRRSRSASISSSLPTGGDELTALDERLRPPPAWPRRARPALERVLQLGVAARRARRRRRAPARSCSGSDSLSATSKQRAGVSGGGCALLIGSSWIRAGDRRGVKQRGRSRYRGTDDGAHASLYLKGTNVSLYHGKEPEFRRLGSRSRVRCS